MNTALTCLLCAVFTAMPVSAAVSGTGNGPNPYCRDTMVSDKGHASVLDTAAANAMGKKLDEYAAIIEREPAAVKCEETDFLIDSCTDSLVRQFTAIRLYGHYVASPVMGDETVAIHIFDRWFSDGKVKMRNELDFLNAKIFAEFNRRSLIGMPAPALSLEDVSGENAVLFADGRYHDRVSVLFFYDSECPTCKMDAILLRNVLGDDKYRLNFYTVYTGSSAEKRDEFIKDYLTIENPAVKIRHFWDPGIKSDFQRKYGLLQTPGLFLISGNGTIVGRRLDPLALKQLLEVYCRPYRYGSEESAAFYDRLFAGYGGNPGCDTVREICDSIARKTVSAGDTSAFKMMAGDLMYWLGSRRGEGLKCGLEYLIGKYIAGMPELWTDSSDSIAVIPYAGLLGDLLGKTEIGGRLPEIKVEGRLKSKGKDKRVGIRLDRLRNTAVIFHTEGCDFCEAELAAADSIALADRRAKFFIVDIDAVLDSAPQTACELFEAIDLSVLPYITVVDGKGRIARKYASLTGAPAVTRRNGYNSATFL